MENKPNLAKAVIAVMKAVKGIDKSMTVGSGTNSYKGVADKDVKLAIGDAMEKNGLCILPIEVDAKTQLDRWEETSTYGTKMKQNVFVEATTKYLLLHESGESQIIAGYGNGVDSQDKAAGKATTYALKYALLYAFMVPTGKIDDADNTHSDENAVPPKTPANTNTQAPTELPWLNETDKVYTQIVEAVKDGKRTIAQLRTKYKISKEVEAKLNEHLPK